MPVTINGKSYTVPDVYGTVRVINLGSVSLPAFNGLLMIFSAKKGVPHNASGKAAYEKILAFSDIKSFKEEYGIGEGSECFGRAKQTGAGVIFCLNAASLTKAKATIKDNAGTPAATMDVEANIYGASGNDISIKFEQVSTNTVVTILPPKDTKFLTANSVLGQKTLHLDNVENLVVGDSIYLTSNTAESPQSLVIESINSETNTIITNYVTNDEVTTDYARIFKEDTDNQEIGTFVTAALTMPEIIEWINTGKILTASRSTYTGAVPTALSKITIGLVTGATKGVSPDATTTAGGNYDTIAENLPQLMEEFRNYTKARIRLLEPITSNTGVMATYKSLAATLRTNDSPIQNIFGVALGAIDLALSNSGHPIQITKSLNDQDSILVAMGAEGKAAYLTLAPLLAGIMTANAPNKNLTWDAIPVSSVEKFFGDSNRDTDLKLYVDSGAIVLRTTPEGFFIAQGVNTYQDHTLEWNEAEQKTYLIQHRQMVDYIKLGYKEQMYVALRNDKITALGAGNAGRNILKKYADEGYIENDYTDRGEKIGNVIRTFPSFRLIGGTDFIQFDMQVLIQN